MDERSKERIAENEALLRDVNERVQEIDRERLESAGNATLFDFLCECGNEGCHEPIRMTVAEYEELRSEALHFAVVPGHQAPQAEKVVRENERFAVIEKTASKELAQGRDPRS